MPNPSAPDDPVGFARHDHDTCVAVAIRAAEDHCRQSGLRFTAVRRRALEILLEEHRAMGAYDVLERLQSEGLGAQPPAAYRALDFLVANGFAHRIEQLNAFIACTQPGADHLPAFLICRDCGKVAEAIALPGAELLDAVARASDFQVESIVVEAQGHCAACRKERGE